MTVRLYYDDPYLTGFDASVVSVEPDADHLVVALDRTAFYPTSGGQPYDTGHLAGVPVVDVIDRDDGSVAHVLDNHDQAAPRAAPRVGELVHGEIDWTRRFDHMQQHTGQHVLSAAFERLFHVRTVSFHLGAEVSTIDLARDVTSSELIAAEQQANQVVWQDRPVAVAYATEAEAAGLPLRKEPKRGGTLRLIDVKDFDLSACGGTHVSRTGAIGIIAIAGSERFKGGARIEFVCGGRALARFRSLRDSVAAGTRMLSVTPAELPQAIERIQSDAREQKRTIVALQKELVHYRAEALAAAARPIALRGGGPALFAAQAVDADASTLKSLALAVTARPGFVAVLVSTTAPALVVVARSADVAAVSAQKVIATLVSQFGGRGGGQPELAQAGGLNGSPDDILSAGMPAVGTT
jgi:alanyl-tRNA synthetase